MLGLELRQEFKGRRLKGTAIELSNNNETGATQIAAHEFLEITYPTHDLLKGIEAVGPEQGRPVVVIGERGLGKSHLMAALFHAMNDPASTSAWLNQWSTTLKNPDISQIRSATLCLSLEKACIVKDTNFYGIFFLIAIHMELTLRASGKVWETPKLIFLLTSLFWSFSSIIQPCFFWMSFKLGSMVSQIQSNTLGRNGLSTSYKFSLRSPKSTPSCWRLSYRSATAILMLTTKSIGSIPYNWILKRAEVLNASKATAEECCCIASSKIGSKSTGRNCTNA